MINYQIFIIVLMVAYFSFYFKDAFNVDKFIPSPLRDIVGYHARSVQLAAI